MPEVNVFPSLVGWLVGCGAPHRILTLFNPLWRLEARTPAIKRLESGIFQSGNQCVTSTVLKHIRDSHFSHCGDNLQCQMLSHYL